MCGISFLANRLHPAQLHAITSPTAPYPQLSMLRSQKQKDSQVSIVTAKSMNSFGKKTVIRRRLMDAARPEVYVIWRGNPNPALLLQTKSVMPRNFGGMNAKIPLQAQRQQTPPSPESLHEPPETS